MHETLKQMLLYIVVFSLMEEPCPSTASMEEEDRNDLCKSEERSQGDRDVGFCSAREETNTRGRDADYMKIKRERKKAKTSL